MQQKFNDHINTKFSFLIGKKLLLAVSGGIDSMVLFRLCQMFSFDFGVAHCNFMLRGTESDEDEAFVNQICTSLNIPIYSQKFDTTSYAKEQKLSIQVAARNLRYDWFEMLLKNHDYDFILTAHHLDDSLETFLINFIRGTGLDGLTSIPQENNKIIRPLLVFSRNEIETFAKEQKIQWREDSSNASDKYFRNKLRHDIIPVLKELNPSLLTSFESTVANLQQSQSMVDDASRIVYRKVVVDTDLKKRINLAELMKLPNYESYLYQWLKPFGFTDWIAITDLVLAQSGKQVYSEKHILLKDRHELILFPKQKTKNSEKFLIKKNQEEIKFPLNISFCTVPDILVQSTNTIFVDEDKINYPLTIRKWEEGDEFFPHGMTGKKKVSKFFKDEKFSLLDKLNTWLLCSDNQIIWIIGKRPDDRFKITNKTIKILQIQLK